MKRVVRQHRVERRLGHPPALLQQVVELGFGELKIFSGSQSLPELLALKVAAAVKVEEPQGRVQPRLSSEE